MGLFSLYRAWPFQFTRKLATHDQAIAGILEAIRQLMVPPPPEKKRPIGFIIPQEKPSKP